MRFFDNDEGRRSDWLNRGVRHGLTISTATMFAVYGYRSDRSGFLLAGLLAIVCTALDYIISLRWAKIDDEKLDGPP